MKRALVVLFGLLLMAQPVAARDVYRSGTGAIRSGFDLDAGVRRSSSSPSADAFREVVYCGTPDAAPAAADCVWALMPGAVLGFKAKMTRELAARPTYATCSTKAYGKGPGTSDDGNGAWYCFRTSAGRYARVQVTHWPTDADPLLRIRYVVWE
jgi:hypothetical protein